jgi:hypothetical protein
MTLFLAGFIFEQSRYLMLASLRHSHSCFLAPLGVPWPYFCSFRDQLYILNWASSSTRGVGPMSICTIVFIWQEHGIGKHSFPTLPMAILRLSADESCLQQNNGECQPRIALRALKHDEYPKPILVLLCPKKSLSILERVYRMQLLSAFSHSGRSSKTAILFKAAAQIT